MKTVLLVFSAIFAVSFADLNPEICSTNGRLCASCNELASCVLSEDHFDILHLAYCDGAGQKCQPGTATVDAKCTTDRVAECDYAHLEFRCKDTGMFPDAFDCRKYHFCVPTEAGGIKKYSATCDRGYGYNPTRTFCSDKLTNNICDPPVPLCDSPGETGPLSNPTLYYICAEYSDEERILYPIMFACPHGSTYDGYVCTSAVRKNVEAILAKRNIA